MLALGPVWLLSTLSVVLHEEPRLRVFEGGLCLSPECLEALSAALLQESVNVVLSPSVQFRRFLLVRPDMRVLRVPKKRCCFILT